MVCILGLISKTARRSLFFVILFVFTEIPEKPCRRLPHSYSATGPGTALPPGDADCGIFSFCCNTFLMVVWG